MAWQRVVKRTSPSVDVDWEPFSVDALNYVRTNYDNTGKRTSFSITLSENALEATYTSVYTDEATKNEFMTDSTVLTEFRRRNAVNDGNNITREIISDAEI